MKTAAIFPVGLGAGLYCDWNLTEYSVSSMGGLGLSKIKPALRSLGWTAGITLVGLAGVAGYWVLANRPNPAVPVSFVTAERGKVENTINESGTVELRGQKTIRSPIEGAVDDVLIIPGQRVRAGQTLLTLRYPERQTSLANQQLLIQQQEATLERNRQRIGEAEAELAVEKQRLNQLANLVTQGAIDRQRFQDQEARVRRAQVAVRDAKASVETGTLELERSRLEKQRLTQQLQNSIVTAPFEAIVLDVKVKDGEGVAIRTDLLTLGDPNQEYIQLRLSTLDAARVRLKQPARISVIGPNPEVFTGKVYNLYPQAIVPENARQGNRQSEQATVPALVKIDKPTRVLIPGSQVNVEIVLDQAQDAVTLNPEAIQRGEGKPFVWVQDSAGKAQKRPVTLGLEGLLNVAITSGLAPGEKVIIPPAEPPLRSGMAVTVEKK